MPPSVANGGAIPLGISTELHCRGWQQAREFTASGFSGIRFSHFKASAINQFVSDFEAAMTNIPFATGISPARWQTGVNVMIEKKPGNFRVDKLCTILLFEADFKPEQQTGG